MGANPDIVRDRTECVIAVVEVENCAEAVLDIVSATWLQDDAIKVKPCSPERTTEEIDVAVNTATCIVPEADIGLRLDVKVDDTDDTVGGQERRQRIDD